MGWEITELVVSSILLVAGLVILVIALATREKDVARIILLLIVVVGIIFFVYLFRHLNQLSFRRLIKNVIILHFSKTRYCNSDINPNNFGLAYIWVVTLQDGRIVVAEDLKSAYRKHIIIDLKEKRRLIALALAEQEFNFDTRFLIRRSLSDDYQTLRIKVNDRWYYLTSIERNGRLLVLADISRALQIKIPFRAPAEAAREIILVNHRGKALARMIPIGQFNYKIIHY